MLEVHIDLGLGVIVTYDSEFNYYSLISNEIPVCSFYVDKDKLPYNTVLCFTNTKGVNSYITFYKEHLELIHENMTSYLYTKESIQTIFNILGIKVIEE